MMSQQMEKLLFEAMDKLPEDLRRAISLRELEGLSYEDIANVMDCPVGTVRSRIFRAREALDKVIQPLLQN
jgi:RNA polymerase sigma-70 factor (ECF subfamily)